jgi:hypothetical protein
MRISDMPFSEKWERAFRLRHFSEEISDSKPLRIGLGADFHIEDGLIL